MGGEVIPMHAPLLVLYGRYRLWNIQRRMIMTSPPIAALARVDRDPCAGDAPRRYAGLDVGEQPREVGGVST